MSFFSDLLGRSSARAATQAGERSMARTNEGYATADTAARTGYDTATGRLQPFAQTAGRGYNLLADSYGVNGADARQRSFETYASDPFNQHSGQVTQNQLMGIMRTANSRGMGNSGATQLAMSRAGLEAQDRRIGDWRQGLGQFGNQAIPLAGTMAGMDTAYYGGVGDRAMGRANALNQTDINATMASNNARMAGVNNLLSGLGSIGSFAMQGFAPGARGGSSAFGNMRNAMTGRQWS
jgi:hypothetical protein